MKGVIFIVKCLLLVTLLSSCSATSQYITIVNRSSKPIEVSYKMSEAKEGLIYTDPKYTDADTSKLDSRKFEPIKDLNSEKNAIKVQLPAGKVLIMGSFTKSDLAGEPEQMNFKAEKYNLTGIKVASEAGEVEKVEEESKSIFQYDNFGNYRVLIIH